MAKAAFNKKRVLFASTLDLNLRKKLIKCYIWSIALYGAETWTLRAADQKHLESFETWCWTRMEKISWTDHVRNEEVLLRVNEQRNILHEIRKQKANWIGHIFHCCDDTEPCWLKCILEVIPGTVCEEHHFLSVHKSQAPGCPYNWIMHCGFLCLLVVCGTRFM